MKVFGHKDVDEVCARCRLRRFPFLCCWAGRFPSVLARDRMLRSPIKIQPAGKDVLMSLQSCSKLWALASMNKPFSEFKGDQLVDIFNFMTEDTTASKKRCSRVRLCEHFLEGPPSSPKADPTPTPTLLVCPASSDTHVTPDCSIHFL